MTNNKSPLVPTPIVDINGVHKIVHKKTSTVGTSASSLPAPGASAPSAARAVNWSNTSTDEAVALAKDAARTLSDPNRIWENFEFYTGMLRSKHRVEAQALFEKDNVLGSLRDAWLDKHGMELITDSEKYYNIKGPDGYKAFIKARDELLEANSRPDSSQFKPSKDAPDNGAGATLNPFTALRNRRDRQNVERHQRIDVEDAVSRALPLRLDDTRGDDVANALTSAELGKAEEILDILREQGDDDAIKNFGRALLIDDNNKYGMTHIVHAHKDYVKENTGHLGILTETAKYLKDNGLDNQQEDGTIPHLEGYVESLRTEMLEVMRMSGESSMNVNAKPYIERAIRRHNKQIADSL